MASVRQARVRPMPEKMLCDTGVWLDYFLGNRARHELARTFVDKCEQGGVSLLVSPASLNDFFHLCQLELRQAILKATGDFTPQQEKAARDVAWADLDNLAELATVVTADASDVWLARTHRQVHADFEDDLVVAAAQRAKADFLITNDEQLLRHAPVAALSVADAIKVLDADATSSQRGGAR